MQAPYSSFVPNRILRRTERISSEYSEYESEIGRYTDDGRGLCIEFSSNQLGANEHHDRQLIIRTGARLAACWAPEKQPRSSKRSRHLCCSTTSGDKLETLYKL